MRAHTSTSCTPLQRVRSEIQRLRDVPPATTPVCHKQEVTVWALVLVLGLAILMAGYILLAKIFGSFVLEACRPQSDGISEKASPPVIGQLLGAAMARSLAIQRIRCPAGDVLRVVEI